MATNYNITENLQNLRCIPFKSIPLPAAYAGIYELFINEIFIGSCKIFLTAFLTNSNSQFWFIEYLFIENTYRGFGYGTYFMQEVLKRLKQIKSIPITTIIPFNAKGGKKAIPEMKLVENWLSKFGFLPQKNFMLWLP